ncbi:MAG: polysaccharide deacetylase family protein [Ruminiclostridium sp.]|nr:polysaccharide deacetylase family protein [Ruminiclostridium sp.]
MKKKILALTLAVSMLMAGCSGNTTSSDVSTPAETSGVTSSATADSGEETSAIEESKEESSVPETDSTTTSKEETSAPETDATTTSKEETSAPETTTTKEPETEATPAPETTTEAEKPAPAEAKYIALTFDDGPNTTTTNQILDILEEYKVKATFFLIGTNINDESAKSVKRAFDMGCEIANHSKTHSYMDKMTEDEMKEEIQYVSDKIFEITGQREKYFRPPYIAVSDPMFNNIDLTFINGTGCNDWDAKVTAEKRFLVMKMRAKDGAIFLLHDAEVNDNTLEMLLSLIPYLLDEGYQLVTLSELFEAKGVTTDGTDKKIYSKVPQDSQW